MRIHVPMNAGAVLAVGALLLAGCGTGGDARDAGGASPSRTAASGSPGGTALPSAPAASRAPAPGKGSKDPDDLNGDGRTDLSLLLPATKPKTNAFTDRRFVTFYGGAHGPDPAVRTSRGRAALGLRAASGQGEPADSAPAGLVTADLDGDGFPEAVSTDTYREDAGQGLSTDDFANQRGVPFVTWGSPEGPRGKAVPLRTDEKISVSGVRRGDFDGDGHPDLAVFGEDASLMGGAVSILYGPFTRDGGFARTETRTLDDSVGGIAVAPLDPTGAHRPTPLFVHDQDDGEQTAGTLYRGGPGKPLFADGGTRTRKGNAYAFGDFDGDKRWDLAIGDDGSRNDEPGYETEAPETEGSYAIYPAAGATSAHKLPRTGTGTSATLRTFLPADPDGDGKDALVVGTPQGPALTDPFSNSSTPLPRRSGPPSYNGAKTPAPARRARPLAARDFDGDGKEEFLLGWGPAMAISGNEDFVYLWIVRGTGSGEDVAAFTGVGE